MALKTLAPLSSKSRRQYLAAKEINPCKICTGLIFWLGVFDTSIRPPEIGYPKRSDSNITAAPKPNSNEFGLGAFKIYANLASSIYFHRLGRRIKIRKKGTVFIREVNAFGNVDCMVSHAGILKIKPVAELANDSGQSCVAYLFQDTTPLDNPQMSYSHEVIEDLLQQFKPVIGVDYERYRNHVYRVFMNCLLLDSDKNNAEKYALAVVFHDIGIWTNQTIDYLDPSIAQIKIYLTETGKPDWIDEITLMIYWHHKISTYQGKYEKTVENFRKADWIDVSFGVLNFGLNKQILKENRNSLPNRGFHWFLTKEITKNFFGHPLNPLPMFTK